MSLEINKLYEIKRLIASYAEKDIENFLQHRFHANINTFYLFPGLIIFVLDFTVRLIEYPKYKKTFTLYKCLSGKEIVYIEIESHEEDKYFTEIE